MLCRILFSTVAENIDVESEVESQRCLVVATYI